MDSLRGRDPGDPSSVDAPFKSPEEIQLSDLRIGFSQDADLKVSLDDSLCMNRRNS